MTTRGEPKRKENAKRSSLGYLLHYPLAFTPTVPFLFCLGCELFTHVLRSILCSICFEFFSRCPLLAWPESAWTTAMGEQRQETKGVGEFILSSNIPSKPHFVLQIKIQIQSYSLILDQERSETITVLIELMSPATTKGHIHFCVQKR